MSNANAQMQCQMGVVFHPNLSILVHWPVLRMSGSGVGNGGWGGGVERVKGGKEEDCE